MVTGNDEVGVTEHDPEQTTEQTPEEKPTQFKLVRPLSLNKAIHSGESKLSTQLKLSSESLGLDSVAVDSVVFESLLLTSNLNSNLVAKDNNNSESQTLHQRQNQNPSSSQDSISPTHAQNSEGFALASRSTSAPQVRKEKKSSAKRKEVQPEFPYTEKELYSCHDAWEGAHVSSVAVAEPGSAEDRRQWDERREALRPFLTKYGPREVNNFLFWLPTSRVDRPDLPFADLVKYFDLWYTKFFKKYQEVAAEVAADIEASLGQDDSGRWVDWTKKNFKSRYEELHVEV